jgi:diaminopimelate epimerase
MLIDFIKMQGCGNDFVIIDNRQKPRKFSAKEAVAIADRRFGIGCDQLVLMEKSRRGDLFMRIYNADGSEVNSCGNASRCVGWLMMNETDKKQISIETKAGIITAKKANKDSVAVNMGKPELEWNKIPLAKKMDTLHLAIKSGPLADPVGVSMGNPHAVFFVNNIGKIDLEELGPWLENHSLFPNKANIGVAEIKSTSKIALRVWERGTGETLACGTGACAALVAANRRGLTGKKATIELPGGDLAIEWLKSGEVLMTGPVAVSFVGVFEI